MTTATGLATLVPAIEADPPRAAGLDRLRPFGRAIGRLLLASRLTPWLVPLGLLALWASASATGRLSPQVLPPPWAIAEAARAKIVDGELVTNIAVSFRRAVSGFLVGGGIAFLLGLANGVSKRSERLTDITVQMIRNIPNLSLIPLVILWFGIGEASKVATIAFGVFSPMAIAAFGGVDGVDRSLIRMAQSFGVPARAIVLKIVLPGAMPALLSGMRISASIGIILLTAAEMIGARYGVGALVLAAGNLMQTEQLIAGVLVLSALGLLVARGIGWLEKRLLAWR